MAKVVIQVPKGIGKSFYRELIYTGIDYSKSAGGITISREGANDSVEADDTVYDSVEFTAINNVINSHQPTVVAPLSGQDSLERAFWAAEARRLLKMSVGNRRKEDIGELLRTIREMGPECIADFLT